MSHTPFKVVLFSISHSIEEKEVLIFSNWRWDNRYHTCSLGIITNFVMHKPHKGGLVKLKPSIPNPRGIFTSIPCSRKASFIVAFEWPYWSGNLLSISLNWLPSLNCLFKKKACKPKIKQTSTWKGLLFQQWPALASCFQVGRHSQKSTW